MDGVDKWEYKPSRYIILPLWGRIEKIGKGAGLYWQNLQARLMDVVEVTEGGGRGEFNHRLRAVTVRASYTFV